MPKTHEWDTQQADSASLPNLGKKYVNEPIFLGLLGDVRDKKVLELGSGNGYWLELISQQGALCTGVEMSDEQLKLARQKTHAPHIRYVKGNIMSLESCGLVNESFDKVFVEHVLLEIPSQPELEIIVRGSYALLKKGGEFIISDLHPSAPSLSTANMKTPSEYSYFSSGMTFEVVSQRIDGTQIQYNDIHWTLEDLVAPLVRVGFHINEIREPRPSQEIVDRYPELLYRRTVPMSIMIKAVKD